jgi:hypothetical protein
MRSRAQKQAEKAAASAENAAVRRGKLRTARDKIEIQQLTSDDSKTSAREYRKLAKAHNKILFGK